MRKIEKELSIILVVCISYLHYHRCIQLEVGTQKLKHGTGSNVILMAIVNSQIVNSYMLLGLSLLYCCRQLST
jgi:hypothetical protein